MNKLFDGLHSYEIALFVLGSILFCALLFAFLYQVTNNREYKNLLMFFFLPILMIGYPSIKKIQYDNVVVDLERLVETSSDKPPDATKKRDMIKKIAELQDRSGTSSRGTIAIARGIAVLGDTAKALELANSAVKLDPQNIIAIDFHQMLEDSVISRIKRTTQLLIGSDTSARSQVRNNLAILSKHTDNNPYSYLVIARAYKAIGEPMKATLYADSVLKFQPSSREAIRLKNQ